MTKDELEAIKRTMAELVESNDYGGGEYVLPLVAEVDRLRNGLQEAIAEFDDPMRWNYRTTVAKLRALLDGDVPALVAVERQRTVNRAVVAESAAMQRRNQATIGALQADNARLRGAMLKCFDACAEHRGECQVLAEAVRMLAASDDEP